jgi:integrase
VLEPLIDAPFNGGPPTWMDDILLEINRHGFFEETHFTIAYSPVPDDTAPRGIGGVLAMAHEITEKVIGERRVEALRDLAARRSELVALDVADLEECPEGLRVTIRRSKTDQEGAGAVVAVCRGSIACPVAAVKEWLAAAGITEGPVFRRVNRGGRLLPGRLRAQSVGLIVKAYAARLGLDADAFSGHSLRSGFLTSAAARGASLFKMMDVSRHKSIDVLRGYVRDADAFRDHAGAGLL